MKQYQDRLVEQIRQCEETITEFGVEIRLKESPNRAGKGHMDPAELSLIKENWAASDQEDAGHPYELDLPPEEMIPFLRDMMGFPNLNLNTMEIITKYETIPVRGREVGLWRYFLRKGKREPKSCLIYIHGGGWFGGSVYTVENPCKFIAEAADAVVFNVDYGLAPQMKFPYNLEECYEAVRHVYRNAEIYGIDPKRITIAGDSAGGNLCAAMCLKDRDEGNHYIAQEILLYPAVTFGRNAAPGYEWHMDAFEIAPGQERTIKGCLTLGQPQDVETNREAGWYFKDFKDASHPYASPMMAGDLSGVAKTVILTAEYDGLRIQGEFYGSQLAKAGVETMIYRYCGCTHAFIDRLGYQPQPEDACRLIAELL